MCRFDHRVIPQKPSKLLSLPSPQDAYEELLGFIQLGHDQIGKPGPAEASMGAGGADQRREMSIQQKYS